MLDRAGNVAAGRSVAGRSGDERDDQRPVPPAAAESGFAPAAVSSLAGLGGPSRSVADVAGDHRADLGRVTPAGDRLGTLRRHAGSGESPSGPSVDRAAGPLLGPLRRSSTPARSGHQLPPTARRVMESTLGADFSTVRVDRRRPARLAALASAAGEQITVSPDRGLDHPGNRPLLGHELTHVLQHRAGRISEAERPELEAEADAVARAIAAGRAAPRIVGAGLAPAAAGPTVELNWGWAAAAGVVRWYGKKCMQKYVLWQVTGKIGDELEAMTEKAIEDLHQIVDPLIDTSQELIETIKRIYALKRAIEYGVEFTVGAMVAPAAMALAEWAGVQDPEFVQLITTVVTKTTARTATWLLFDRQMLMLAHNVDLMAQSARTGAVQPALGMVDKVGSSASYFDMYRTFDHYAFLRFLYKDRPGSAVDLVKKAKDGVMQADSALSGFSVEARSLAKRQVPSPSVVSSVGFSVLGEAAYGGIRVWQGKESASLYTTGKYLTRGVGAGLGQFTMTALVNWSVPLLTGAVGGPILFIPQIVLGSVGGYLGRMLFQSAYESAPGLWGSFSGWMWPGGGGGGGGNPPPGDGGPAPRSRRPRPRSGHDLDEDRPDQGASSVVIPRGPTAKLTAPQIEAILLLQLMRRPTSGLFVPLVPTWQLLMSSGLGGPAVGLAMGLTGWPVQRFVPTSLATPQLLGQVGRFPPPEIEEGGPPAPQVQAKPGDEGLNPSQQDKVAVATGKAVNVLAELLVAAKEVESEERQ